MGQKDPTEVCHAGISFEVPIVTYPSEDLAAQKKGRAVDSEEPGTATSIHGDWVLFHPVYTPEELKAVEESRAYEMGHSCIHTSCL